MGDSGDSLYLRQYSVSLHLTENLSMLSASEIQEVLDINFDHKRLRSWVPLSLFNILSGFRFYILWSLGQIWDTHYGYCIRFDFPSSHQNSEMTYEACFCCSHKNQYYLYDCRQPTGYQRTQMSTSEIQALQSQNVAIYSKHSGFGLREVPTQFVFSEDSSYQGGPNACLCFVVAKSLHLIRPGSRLVNKMENIHCEI